MGDHHGINDRFAYGTPMSMKYYGNRLDSAIEYCEKYSTSLHSESFVNYIINKYKLIKHNINEFASRVRGGGNMLVEVLFPRQAYENIIKYNMGHRVSNKIIKLSEVHNY